MVWKPDAPAHIKALYICLNVIRKQSRSSSHSQKSQLNAAEPLFSSQRLLVLPKLLGGWWGTRHENVSPMFLWTFHALCINSLYWLVFLFPSKDSWIPPQKLSTSFLSSICLYLHPCICRAANFIRAPLPKFQPVFSFGLCFQKPSLHPVRKCLHLFTLF